MAARVMDLKPSVKAAMGGTQGKNPPGVLDCRIDLLAVAHDALVGEQALAVRFAICRNGRGIET